jgi:hypothetical protein
MDKYGAIRKAARKFPKIEVCEVVERPVLPQGNEIADKLMAFVFRGTDIPDLANYPKRSGRNTI